MAKDRIETELRADSAQLRAEFSKAQRKVRRFTDGVKKAATSVAGIAAGAIGLRAGVAVFGDLLDKFDRVGKLANRFDLPEEEVQKLAVAAEVSGSNMEKLVAALTKATVAGVEASQGLQTYKRAFRDLNVDVDVFNKASPDEKLAILARAFNEAKDDSVAFTAAYRILGKAGADLIPLLRENADGIAKLSKGLSTLSAEDVQAIEDFNDEMTLLKANLQAEIAREFAGELSDLKDDIKEVGAGLLQMTKFLIEHRGAIQAVIAAWAAYKGIKLTATLTTALAVMIQTRLQLAASAAATNTETAAVSANTAAWVANSRARALAAVSGSGKTVGKGAALGLGVQALAANATTKGGVVGSLFGKAMGGAAAARFGLGFIAKFSPHVLAAAIGAGVGKLAGDWLAEEMSEAADAKLRNITAPLHDVLRITHELVNEARTQKETDAARARIKQEIKRLTEVELANASGQKRAEIEHTIEVLKRRDAAADTARIRNVARETEAKILKELALQHENALFEQKVRL